MQRRIGDKPFLVSIMTQLSDACTLIATAEEYCLLWEIEGFFVADKFLCIL